MFVLPLFAKMKLRVVQFRGLSKNDFVVVTGTGSARDFIRLLAVELH